MNVNGNKSNSLYEVDVISITKVKRLMLRKVGNFWVANYLKGSNGIVPWYALFQSPCSMLSTWHCIWGRNKGRRKELAMGYVTSDTLNLILYVLCAKIWVIQAIQKRSIFELHINVLSCTLIILIYAKTSICIFLGYQILEIKGL